MTENLLAVFENYKIRRQETTKEFDCGCGGEGMKDNTLYLFIDEGGNFDFSPSGTKYFTLSCLAERRPFPSYDKLREIKYDLIEDGINIEYFHATADKQFVRDNVFHIINRNLKNIKVDTMIVQKNKANPALYPEEKFIAKFLRC